MILVDLHTKFLRYCALEENLSPRTIRGIKSGFKTFLKRSALQNLNEINLNVIREFFYEGREKYQWSTSSVLNHMKYLKKFFNWCIDNGYRLLRFLESDINNKPEEVIERLKHELK